MNPGTSPNPPAPFSCTFSPNVPELLHQLQCTIALSTYQAGKVVLLSSADGERLIQLPRSFRKPMGIALKGQQLAIATRDEVHLLTNAPGLAAHYPPKPGTYDALFMPRATYYTGQIDIHDLEWGKDGLYAVNTSFSCICKIDEHFSFTPVWKPPFISQLAHEDRCHLNGMAMKDKKPRFATAFNRGNERQSWRENITKSGVLIDIESSEIVLHGLAMPHSPRLYEGQLFLLLSATGELVRAEPQTGKFEVLNRLNGFVRGLGCIGDATILTFGDLDGDGDLDMLTGRYDASYYGTYFAYYENTGTPTAPEFGPAVLNPFGLILEDGTDSTAPQLADLDNDGDLDLLVGTYFYGTEQTATVYFQNIGTAEAPAFSPPQVTPFGLQLPLESYLFLPALADFDNDGDLDIVSGGSYQYEGDMYLPSLDYYENTGTAQAPSFAPPQRNAFGLQSDLNSFVVIPAAADLDADGDVDVLTTGLSYEAGSGLSKVIFEYFENTAVINAVDMPETDTGFQLFPTVAREEVQWQVEAGRTAGQLRITIFDLNGRQFRQEEVIGKAGTLSISDLPGGLYQARLTDEQGQLLGVQRIVKP